MQNTELQIADCKRSNSTVRSLYPLIVNRHTTSQTKLTKKIVVYHNLKYAFQQLFRTFLFNNLKIYFNILTIAQKFKWKRNLKKI